MTTLQVGRSIRRNERHNFDLTLAVSGDPLETPDRGRWNPRSRSYDRVMLSWAPERLRLSWTWIDSDQSWHLVQCVLSGVRLNKDGQANARGISHSKDYLRDQDKAGSWILHPDTPAEILEAIAANVPTSRVAR